MTDETPELPTFADIVEMLAELGTLTTPMGRRGRQLLFALHEVARDHLAHMSGMLAEGEPIPAAFVRHYAPCGCKDERHRFTRDGWFGRAGWLDERADAEERKDKVRGHVVTRLLATSDTEVIH